MRKKFSSPHTNHKSNAKGSKKVNNGSVITRDDITQYEWYYTKLSVQKSLLKSAMREGNESE